MSKKLLYVFSIVLVLSLVGRVSAQEADVIIRSPDAAMPFIDGVVDDVWSVSTEQTIAIVVNGTDPGGPADCSGTWRALWDWEYIYGLVVVKDEALNNDSGVGSKWNDDSVEFYVDGDNSKAASPDENDHQYSFRWNNTELEEPSATHNGEPSLVGVEYAVTTTGDGYIFEVRIPWTSIMGTAPTPSQEIGIEVWINDDDDGGDRDSQISWYGTDGAGWNTPSLWATGLLVAGNIAGAPKPANGAMHTQAWANLEWIPGPTAVSHDVYIGDNFDDVNDGTPDSSEFIGNQAVTNIIVGFPGFPYSDGLVPGATYYWRIDEVEADGTTIYKGPVWSFMIPPKTAYWPVPADGAESIDPDLELSWTAGYDARLHTVYFGDNFDDVNNDAGGIPQGITTYTPGPLKMAKTYYWRVDEFDAFDTYKGDVWSFTTEGGVGNPDPSNGAAGVEHTPILTWTPGVYADSHQVYFGTDKDAVRNADTSSPEYKGTGNLGSESYEPGKLQWFSTYYWRIDEANNINPDSPWTGSIWSFTTADFIVIDDIEDYNDYPPDEIFSTWVDGYLTTTNGSMAGYPDPTFAETGNVHGGAQSMPLSYDNNFKYSEATMTLTQRNWTEEDVGILSLWFRGDADNAAERMYVALNGSAVVYHDNPNAAQLTAWTQWTIDLQDFAAQGVNLANVNTITIGFGDKNNLQAGGSGMVLFDDLRLYRLAQ